MDVAAQPPAVSVLIPCHNLGQYVEEAVDSVLGQTFQDVEIVIVNDGSTDPATNRILAELRRPRTRVITTENRGVAAARNLAILNTTGRYLCALDADDKLAPTYLEKAIGVLEADPDVAFVSTWVELFGHEEWTWKQERCDLPALLAECTVMTAALVRREAVSAVGGYDAKMPAQGDEDWDLWLSIVERGYRGTIVPESLFYYRQRPGSMRHRCGEGLVRVDQLRYLTRKHADSYRRHLVDVLTWNDREIGNLLRSNHELERHLQVSLQPRLHLRRQEREWLGRRLAKPAQGSRSAPAAAGGPANLSEPGTEPREQDLLRAVESLRAEVTALRQSMSWKITGPLRAVYGWMLRARNRASQ